MVRKREGFRLSLDARTGCYLVRFTHNGRAYKFSTRERDLGRATTAAVRIFTEVVNGTQAAARTQSDREQFSPAVSAPSTGATALGSLIPLDELFARWLENIELALDPTTVAVYKGYARARFIKFFGSLNGVTAASVDNYVRTRLRRVKRTSVKKELSALRGFVAWCQSQGYLVDAPRISSPPRTALGVEFQGGRRRKVRVELTEHEVDLVLAQLPKRTRGRLAARAFFTTMIETTLRRETLFCISVPGDYAKGRGTLKIREEADKARFAREVPLSGRAREALDSVCPEQGPIFRRANYRNALYAAAKAAGLSEERSKHLSYHDFRHAALTHMASDTTDLAGMAFLAGHKHITTTALYVHSSQKAAERALEARERRRS